MADSAEKSSCASLSPRRRRQRMLRVGKLVTRTRETWMESHVAVDRLCDILCTTEDLIIRLLWP